MQKHQNPVQFRSASHRTGNADASLQFVRKLSGFNTPSRANEAAFNRATEDVAEVTRVLINSLTTVAEPRDREAEAARARAKAAIRFRPQD